jgi:uncharacterized protein
MHRWIRVPLFVLASVAAAGAALAAPVPDYPFIYAEGSATREVPPDLASFSFSVSAANATSQGAIAQVQGVATQVLALLARTGIRDADIEAASLATAQQSHWDEKTRRNVPDGYTANRGFAVKVRDLTRYPALYRALLEMPSVSGGGGSFERSDRSRVSAELVAEAAKAAREQGERMAAGLGRKLGSARAIAQIPMAEIPGRFGLGAGGGVRSRMALQEVVVTAQRSADSSLVPASIEISEGVNVLFELQ